MTEEPRDGAAAERYPHGPGIGVPPPTYFLGGLLAAWLLERRWPVPILPARGVGALPFLGAALVVLGVAWAAWGALTFRRARTTVLPHRPASCLVEAGPYRFGRNPMYLGMSLAYWGAAAWMNSLWAPLLFPVVIVLLLRRVVRREEEYLTAAFGEEYAEYCRRVPRWLSLRR